MKVVAIILSVAMSMILADRTGAQPAHLDLQSLIDAAEPGTVISLENAVYRGNVMVDRSITIDGHGVATIDAGGAGNGFEVIAPDVTLRGLTIRNTGDSLDRENAGVSAREAPRLTVLDCTFEDVLFGVFARQSPGSTISGNHIGAKDLDPGRRGDAIRVWETHGSVITANVVDGGRDSVMWYSDDLLVAGNSFTNGRYGLHFMYSHGATIRDNVLEGNSVGAFLMYSKNLTFTGNFVGGSHGPSGYGLGMKEVDGAQIADNHFVGNRIGVYFDYSPISFDVTHHFTGNLVAYNEVGLMFLPNVERNVFSRNAFVENRDQVAISSGGEFTGNEWTLDGVGNHWDDFGGYDSDGDGIGDIPYKLDDLYSALTDAHPEILFFADTPAARAVDMAGRLFPTLRPRPKVVDDAPLVRMPVIAAPATGATQSDSSGLLGVSAALLLMAAAIAATSRRRTGVLL